MQQARMTKADGEAALPAAVLTLTEIVEGGLCIGCGLCRSMAPQGAVQIVLTPEGRERPVARAELAADTLARINAVCPGTRIAGPDPAEASADAVTDDVWGSVERICIGHAGDPAVQFAGSSGGVLTALGQFLVTSGRVGFVLHLGAQDGRPMRSEAKLSADAPSVLDGAGSRYGPGSPLADFHAALDRGEPFALIGKPCDVTAARNLARVDPRVDRLMLYALAFVCGGASDLSKSESVLQRFGVSEDDSTLFRYRGHGNPGVNRIETRDGRAFTLTYRQMWEDAERWMIQPRCKICPDAIGQAADIVASDAWLNGGPAVDDEGLNGIFVRTTRGTELLDAAVAAGAIRIRRESSFAEFDVLQSHQVVKRSAVWARLKGMTLAGRPVPTVTGLALEACARGNSVAANLSEARGAYSRARSGRLGEPPAVARATP